MFFARARLLRHSSRHPCAEVAFGHPAAATLPCPQGTVSSRTGVKPVRPVRSGRLERSPDQPSTVSVYARCRILQRAAGDRHAAFREEFRHFFSGPASTPLHCLAAPRTSDLTLERSLPGRIPHSSGAYHAHATAPSCMQQPRDQAHQRCAWSRRSALACVRMSPLAALPQRQRGSRQAILADLALPFISRIGPFRLIPITRIRRQPPTAAGPPPRPAPSMARITRSLPKRATTCCISRTAVNPTQIHGRSQRERHSRHKEFEPRGSCHQPLPRAVAHQ